MISEAKCINKTCNICYEEMPSFHCSQCSFVICNTCKSAMSQLNIDNKCSQCRKEKPWLKAYELNSEISNNMDETNIPVHIYQDNDCSCKIKITDYLKKFCYLFTAIQFITLLGYIWSNIDGSIIHINNFKIQTRLVFFFLNGLLVSLALIIIFFVIMIIIVQCTIKINRQPINV